jgi:hypothetical protein
MPGGAGVGILGDAQGDTDRSQLMSQLGFAPAALEMLPACLNVANTTAQIRILSDDCPSA